MLSKAIIQVFISVCVLSVSLTSHAEEPDTQTEEDQKVYRKFHPDGVVEFSDQPSRGSEELEVEELPTYKFTPAVPAAKPAPRPKQQTRPKPGLASPYRSLTINSPSHGETLRANSGDIDVKFTLVPGLQFYKGHKFEYLLDGESILKTDRPQTLKNLDRGGHSLLIQVIDQNDKLLIKSGPVSFHIKRFFKPKPSSKKTPLSPTEPDFNTEDET